MKKKIDEHSFKMTQVHTHFTSGGFIIQDDVTILSFCATNNPCKIDHLHQLIWQAYISNKRHVSARPTTIYSKLALKFFCIKSDNK